MNREDDFLFTRASRQTGALALSGLTLLACCSLLHAALDEGWQTLPLITDGKIDSGWTHIGYGKFVVDAGTIRTESDPKGLGLLVYNKDRLGNCQIRVVFKSKEPKSNSGVYVRIADGILEQAGHPGAALERDAEGKPSEESSRRMEASSEKEEGPWFAVHRGYEVQISDGPDPLHRTGAIYSLAPSSESPNKPATQWRTLVITLTGNRILVDLEGKRVTTFDSTSNDLPKRAKWYEPKREPKRPQAGYIGLQTHDPKDVVWFKEISVRRSPDRN